MSARCNRLARLLAIRRLSEDRDRRGLQSAMAAVAEVDREMARQVDARGTARSAARAAMARGDRDEWLMAEAQDEVAGWNRQRLAGLLQVRAAEVPPARERFLASQLEHEQVKQLVDDRRRVEREEENRRAQAAADDWFLAKREKP